MLHIIQKGVLIMFCKKCGNEVNDEAVICIHCGCELDNGKTKDNNQSKTGIGVVMALFLGVIGLIIGICLYPAGTIARKTFIKAWLITYIVEIVASIVFGVIVYVLAIGLFLI